jgi:rfaE bifunctional protein nucleotidyltransferase chain/domain
MKLQSSKLVDWLESRTLHPANLKAWREQAAQKGLRIATLNGSFDLMHSGHLEIIYEASQQADILVVGLNTDASIKKYKSANRPIIPLQDRLAMMAALAMVDYVSYFDETDPIEWLKKIKPHVHVNGIEYGENCIEAPIVKEMGGRLHLVDRSNGASTSGIIERIRAL